METWPDDLMPMTTLLSNVVFVGEPGSDKWLLVDAGMPGFCGTLVETAKERFRSSPPQAIVLTHAHFDHVGSLEKLLQVWDVPVYAHEKELPYLTGADDYPEPDPSVGGGLFSLISPLFPAEGWISGRTFTRFPQTGRSRTCRAGSGSLRRATPEGICPSSARPTGLSLPETPLPP